MAVTINGDGTISGVSVGGLPDGVVDSGTLATNSVDSAELIDGAIDDSHLATGIDAGKLINALPSISGASLTSLPAGSNFKTATGTYNANTTGTITIGSLGFAPLSCHCQLGPASTGGGTYIPDQMSFGWAVKTGATTSTYGLTYLYIGSISTTHDQWDTWQTANYMARMGWHSGSFNNLTVTAWDATSLTMTKTYNGAGIQSDSVRYSILIMG